jgi:hypothetical protein
MESSRVRSPFEARFYFLEGEGLSIAYRTSDTIRPMRWLSVGDRTYAGSDVRVSDSVLGLTVTVTESFAYDGDSHTLSVLLPQVNFGDAAAADVETVAIRTVHRGSIGGPAMIDGALESHTCIPVRGRAHVAEPDVASAASSDRIACAEWSAWYNRMPGQVDEKLRVWGMCTRPSSSIELRLEPRSDGVVEDPKLFVLQLTATTPPVGDDLMVTEPVFWEGNVGSEIEQVRIQGEADALIDVVIAR